jgi:hypothetical protein
MVVVPECIQRNAASSASVAEQFFNLTYSGYAYDSSASCSLKPPETVNINKGYQIFASFLAVSSFGNVVVMTFTAARVKQEIAKQGILPWSKFFAEDHDVSIGRLLKWFQMKGWFTFLFRFKWFHPNNHTEKTPLGALLLHIVTCIILILATLGIDAQDAYTLHANVYVYVINTFFGIFLGLGILILRFKGPPPTDIGTESLTSDGAGRKTWTEMTGPKIKPVISITAAIVYMVGSAWPIANLWVPPVNAASASLKWFVIPTMAWTVLAISATWFIGFLIYAKRREKKFYEVFTIDKDEVFENADESNVEAPNTATHGLILDHERVYLSWQAKEIMERD